MANTFVSSLIGWVLISTPLHLAWEVLHVRFYTLWQEASTGTIVYAVLHCTVGDAMIAAAAFVIAAAATRRRDWPQHAEPPGSPTRPRASGSTYIGYNAGRMPRTCR